MSAHRTGALLVLLCLQIEGRATNEAFNVSMKVSPLERFEAAQKAALTNNAAAQFYLGDCYQHASGTKLNITAARDWYVKAAQQGYTRAHVALGELYTAGVVWDGGVIQANHQEALRWFLAGANLGNAEAQYEAARLYDSNFQNAPNGRKEIRKNFLVNRPQASRNKISTVAPNWVEARRWYERAAAQGQSAALNNLGVMWWFGQGGPADQVEAYKFFRLAAKKENATAIDNVTAAGKVLPAAQIDEGKSRADLVDDAKANGIADLKSEIGKGPAVEKK